MPNNYEQLLNGNFREMYCYETFKVEEITIKKAEANVVFNATKKFEENKFYEYCLKISHEQLLNGKTTRFTPSQSF